jgi:hypothetical protein
MAVQRQPRAPCVLHEQFINATDAVLQGIAERIRSKYSTSVELPVCVLQVVQQSKARSSYATTWKRIYADAGTKLTITWHGWQWILRWLFECFAAKWAIEHL